MHLGHLISWCPEPRAAARTRKNAWSGSWKSRTFLRSKRRYERGGGLPIEGQDLLEIIQSVEIGENADVTELKEAIDEALAFKEGLEFAWRLRIWIWSSWNKYNQYDKQKIGYLEKMFTTVEGASERPQAVMLI